MTDTSKYAARISVRDERGTGEYIHSTGPTPEAAMTKAARRVNPDEFVSHGDTTLIIAGKLLWGTNGNCLRHWSFYEVMRFVNGEVA